jgi:hypothetical protein
MFIGLCLLGIPQQLGTGQISPPVFAIIRNPTLPPNYKIYFQEPLVKILNVFSETTKLIEKWGYGV